MYHYFGGVYVDVIHHLQSFTFWKDSSDGEEKGRIDHYMCCCVVWENSYNM